MISSKKYYIRRDNLWKEDVKEMMCNMKPDCIELDDNCKEINTTKAMAENNSTSEILSNEFIKSKDEESEMDDKILKSQKLVFMLKSERILSLANNNLK